MTDLEFIKKFSKITIKDICKELKVNSANLYNGKASKKNELKVALDIIKKVYRLIDEYNVEDVDE